MRISDWSSDVCSSDLLFELFLDLVGRGQLVLLGLPARGQGRRTLFEFGQLALERVEAIARCRVTLLFQRLALDLELDDAPVEFVDLDRKSTRLNSSH